MSPNTDKIRRKSSINSQRRGSVITHDPPARTSFLRNTSKQYARASRRGSSLGSLFSGLDFTFVEQDDETVDSLLEESTSATFDEEKQIPFQGQGEEKEAQDHKNGNSVNKMFTYLSLPLLAMTLGSVVFYAIMYSNGYGWSPYIVAIAKGLRTPLVDSRSRPMNIHGLTGITTFIFLTLQVLSGLKISFQSSTKKSQDWHRAPLTRFFHRFMGWFTAFLLVFCSGTGLYFLKFTEQYGDQKVLTNSFLIFGAVASLANLTNGILAVLPKVKEERDYFRHKVSMYFVMFWLTGFTQTPQFVVMVTQLFIDRCVVGFYEKAIITMLLGWIWFFLQITVARWALGPQEFGRWGLHCLKKYSFLRYNFILFLGVLLTGSSLMVFYFVFRDPSATALEGACLTV